MTSFVMIYNPTQEKDCWRFRIMQGMTTQIDIILDVDEVAELRKLLREEGF